MRVRAVDPVRRAMWLDLFGRDWVEVLEGGPELVITPGRRAHLAYAMDLRALTPEERRRLCEALGPAFGYSPEEVDARLDGEGCPVLAAGVELVR